VSIPPLQNIFNGGTDGQLITPANSGDASGDPFDVVTGSIIDFSSAQAYSGALSARVPDATANANLKWAGFGFTNEPVNYRVHLWLSAFPSGAGWVFLNGRNAADSYAFGLRVTVGGFIGVNDQSGTSVASGTGTTATVPLSQWCRVEAEASASTTLGSLTWRLFTDPTSVAAADSKTVTNQNFTASQDMVNIGSTGPSFPTVPFTPHIDEVAVSAGGWLGPLNYQLLGKSSPAGPSMSETFGPF
jgi:hypothetical protein